MMFESPFWIFPLLPILLTLLCAGAVYWALTRMAPLGNQPRLATPTAAPRASAVRAAPATPAVTPPAAVRAPSVGDPTLATLLDTPAATVLQGAKTVVMGDSNVAQGSKTVVMGDSDLTIVEGIGPRIAAVLTAAGIPTLAALGAADPTHLERILRDAGLNLAQPATWPEQARLAAAGRMDELKQLQERLRAGNRR